MKNSIFSCVLVLVLALLMLGSLAGCTQEPQAEGTTTVPPTEAPTVPPTEAPTAPPTELPTELPTDPPVKTAYSAPEGVPLYTAEELLLREGGIFDLQSTNFKNYYHGTSDPNALFQMLAAYPTNAIRIREDNSLYLMYDLVEGFRVYVGWHYYDSVYYPTEAPVIVGEVLSWEEFEPVSRNDRIPVSEIAKVDPSVQFYEAWYRDKALTHPVDELRSQSRGFAMLTLHYFKEGLGVTYYGMGITKDQKFSISSQGTLLDLDRGMYGPVYDDRIQKPFFYNYTIEPEDLPQKAPENHISVSEPTTLRQNLEANQAKDHFCSVFNVDLAPDKEDENTSDVPMDASALRKSLETLFSTTEQPMNILEYGQIVVEDFRRQILNGKINGYINLSGAQDGVPVYTEDTVVLNGKGVFYPCRDGCFYENSNASFPASEVFFGYFPTTAIRLREDGVAYMIYDTDTGYRFYLYQGTEPFDRYIHTGFPVFIKDPHSIREFEGLQIGDPYEKVAEIDSAAAVQMRTPMERWSINVISAKNKLERGYPITTIHYLTDGILKIEYTMEEEGKWIIANMVYNENYELVNANGRTVNYKLDDRDLPWK